MFKSVICSDSEKIGFRGDKHFLVKIYADEVAARQSYIVLHNLLSTMRKDSPKEKYNGYGACPLITSYNTVILAEFIYGNIPHETFFFDQSQESVIAFYMKRYLFPFIYWNLSLQGYYNGPGVLRKILNPFGW